MSTPRCVVGAAMLFLLAPMAGYGQETATLTLAAAIAAVEDRNAELAAAELLSLVEGHRADQAGRWSNPEISVYQERFPGADLDADQWIFSASQRLRIGGQLGLASEEAAAGQAAAEWDARALRAELVLRMQREYVALQASQARLGAVRAALESTRSLLRDMEARNREGDVSDFDVGRLRLEAQALELRAREIGADITDAGTRLAEITGLTPPEDGWRLAPLSDQPGGPPGLLADPSRERSIDAPDPEHPGRPELLAAMQRQRQASLRQKLVQRQKVPDLQVTAGYSRIDPGYGGFVWSVSAVLPLFGRDDSAAAAAAVEERVRERRTAALERRIWAQRELAWNAYASATEALGALDPGTGSRLVETARIAYGEGALSVTALLDTVQADLEATFRRIELERRRNDGWFLWQWASGRAMTDYEVIR